MIEIIDVTDSNGEIVALNWLILAEPVHRQLRPKLLTDYVQRLKRIFAGGGRMCVAVRNQQVMGLSVYRILEKTFDGRQMYVDDLVTDEAARSNGVGKALIDHVQKIARASGCETFTLDSGTQRTRAHQFYFREGLVVTAFHFFRPLDSTQK